MDAEVVASSSVRRRLWTMDEKRRIVEQTLSSDMSVAMIARQHGVNANQVFYWRKLYHAGELGTGSQSEGVRLLPVSVNGEEPASTLPQTESRTGVTMNIEIPGGALVSIEGALDAAIVRAVIESLRG